MTLSWLTQAIAPPDNAARERALARQAQLTKPAGALGRLEGLAVQLAALQGDDRPSLARVGIVVFAADHGFAAEGTSAYPQAVTGEMVKNFAAGGAAISVLAKTLGARLEVVNLGTLNDPGPLPGVVAHSLGPGTASACRGAAMTEAQLAAALEAGRAAALRARDNREQLFIGGDMGIGNTAAATALACALLRIPAAALAGPGTGLDGAGVARKAALIQAALEHHSAHLKEPLEILRRLGGFEIAALVGSQIACAQAGLPVLVDGFIAGAAALLAVSLQPALRPWLLFGHRSAEPGHARILAALDAQPLLALEMRLGEGSGAAAALPLLRLACALHNGMATFAEAGVSEQASP
jgi:nicotinate-nucleotide--dimethylbenzimidazole phosphoribosyltransferase